jgi:RND family efflux transporter MFP subunit
LLAAACGPSTPDGTTANPTRVPGVVYAVKDTSMQGIFEASGTAAPVRQATLSTKLMGTVLEVLAQEGQPVAAGQPLVRIDARDLTAKASQVAASVADADAQRKEAQTHAGRIRALYADSAATRAQLDAAETGLARAEAGARAARGAAAELGAMSDYSVVRAPFAGIVTKRYVDPGAFAAPGAPLMSVQDGLKLRITASATPDVARLLERGQSLDATIEGRTVGAIVEGIVPSQAGNLYVINAIVANPGGAILPGSTATLRLPMAMRRALVVPTHAVTRQGDLTGVTIRTAAGDETRWIRLGRSAGTVVEVNAGLRAGDLVVVPLAGGPPVAARN